MLKIGKNYGNRTRFIRFFDPKLSPINNIDCRARTNRTPTLIHCLDGVGRSGTLVVIESVLQQLLKGPNLRDPIGTMAMFVRLQRRHAVLDEVQWMFIYRSILELIKPFIAARYHRLVLGLTAKKRFGFIKKYNEFIEQQRMPYI